MPEISFFYGIKIMIYHESNAPHHKPRFHASYGEYEAVYSIEGACLQAAFPRARQNSS